MIHTPIVTYDSTKAMPLSALNNDAIFGVASEGELTEYTAYKKVSWVRRCVDMRANALSSIPFAVYRGESNEIEWEFANILPGLLWQTSAALQIYGAAYWIRQRNRFTDRGYRWVLPTTIKPIFDEAKGLVRFERKLPTRGTPVVLELDDIIYFWSPPSGAELGPGPGWVTTALPAAEIINAADEMVRNYFDHGAILTTLLSVSGNPPRAELDRLESWWKRLVKGVKSAGETVAVRAEIEPKVIGTPLEQVALQDVVTVARQQIATAAGVPQTMLEDAANYATATEHRQSFYTETVVPESVIIETALNKQLFGPQNLTFNLDWQGLDLFQVDEAQRSESLARLTQAGLPVEFAMELLGFDLPNNMSYDDLAAMLKDRKAENVATFGGNGVTLPATEPTQPATVPPVSTQPTATRAVSEDLDRWRRKALSSLKAGGVADVPFVSDVIPDAAAEVLHERLAYAASAKEVREIFENPFVEVKVDRVEPEGEPLEPVDMVRVTPEDVDAAIARWNRVMPSEYAGILEAGPEAAE